MSCECSSWSNHFYQRADMSEIISERTGMWCSWILTSGKMVFVFQWLIKCIQLTYKCCWASRWIEEFKFKIALWKWTDRLNPICMMYICRHLHFVPVGSQLIKWPFQVGKLWISRVRWRKHNSDNLLTSFSMPVYENKCQGSISSGLK